MWGSTSAASQPVCALAQDEVAQLLGTSHGEEQTNLLPTRGFQAENTQKEFSEIPGRQRHIWLMMKITYIGGNILDRVSVLDGIGTEGNGQRPIHHSCGRQIPGWLSEGLTLISNISLNYIAIGPRTYSKHCAYDNA